MWAEPVLTSVAGALRDVELDAVLIGNAAAALHGAPVTTIDLDFLIRRTPVNARKLKALAKALDAVVFRPYYPVSGLFRLMRNADNLEVDFMTAIHGIRSFKGLRARSEEMPAGGEPLRVAALADVIASKKAAGRPSDHAVLGILEAVLHEKEGTAEKAQRPAKPAGGARRAKKRK